MRELWYKIAHTSGARIYSLIIGVVSLAITARWLGPEGRGTIATVTTWVGLFSTFGYLSLGQVAIHQATQKRNENWIAPILGSLLFLAVLISFIGWVVALFMYGITQGNVFEHLPIDVLLVGFLALPFFIWERYGSSLLMATDQFAIYNNAQIVARTINVFLIVGAMLINAPLVSVLIITLITQAVVALAGLNFLFKHAVEQIRPNWTTIKTLLLGGLKLHLNAIGSVLIMSTDILLINHYHGTTETGLYQLAVQLVSILLIVPESASKILYGKVTQMGPDGAWLYQRKILIWVIFGMIGIAGVSAVCSPWAIPLVAGSDFTSSVFPFQLLLIALIGMTFSTVMGSQWIVRGMFWQVSAITMTIGLLNLIAGLILIPRYGMYGSIIGTILTYIVSVFINGSMAVWCEMRYRKQRLSENSICQ